MKANPDKIYLKRQSALAAAMAKQGLGALCVSSLINLRYICGFNCSFGRLLCLGKKVYLLTDSRYTADAGRSAVCSTVVETNQSQINEVIKDLLRSHGLKSAGFEQDAVSHGEYLAMRSGLRGIRLEAASGIVEELRIVKDEGEIEAVRKACRIGDRAFRHITGIIRPGMSEKRIAAELDAYMVGQGIDGLAFDSIVASGPRGAFPHAKPSGRKVRNGDLITMDFGVKLGGYNSDMTRTVAVGQPAAALKKIYHATQAAQAAACARARPGVAAATLDGEARKTLARYALDKYFTHGLGHGVGLEVHENPRVSSVSEAIIKKNMIFTIEPGVYAEGLGGVRIEDTVAATKDGIEILTRSPKKLIIL